MTESVVAGSRPMDSRDPPEADSLIECSVKVEEKKDCIICSSRNADHWYDIFWTETEKGQKQLMAYICRIAEAQLVNEAEAAGAVVCNACVLLINALERAELEYVRMRSNFVAILASSSGFEKIVIYEENNKKSYLEVEIVKKESEETNAAGNKTISTDVSAVEIAEVSQRKKRSKRLGRKKKEIKQEFSDEEDEVSLSVVKRDNDNARQQSGRCVNIHDQDVESEDFTDWAAPEVFSDDDYEPPALPKSVKSRTQENGRKLKPNKMQKKLAEAFNELDKGDGSVIKEEECITKGTTIIMPRPMWLKRIKKENKRKPVFPCPECKETFNSIARLKAHKRSHEKSKGPFICEICGAHYKHKKACDIHVDLHKGISDWKCEECNKLFPSKGALHRHNNIHTGKPNYQCDLCGKSFIHTSSFKMHKLAHSGLKPHSCDVCGLALMTKSHLKRHKRIHSGEKKHECTICNKRFSERYNLLAHQKSHEEGAKDIVTNKKIWARFRCHMCEKRFDRRYMVEKHMEVEHQTIMEKGPPKPRNTMTKLLKAQAATLGRAGARADLRSPGEAQATLLHNLLHNKSASSHKCDSTENDKKESSKGVKASAVSKDTEVDNKSTGGDKIKISPRPNSETAKVNSSSEVYEALRLANGTWPQYIPSEYLRLPEFQQ